MAKKKSSKKPYAEASILECLYTGIKPTQLDSGTINSLSGTSYALTDDELIRFWTVIKLRAELVVERIKCNKLRGWSSEGTHQCALHDVHHELASFTDQEIAKATKKIAAAVSKNISATDGSSYI